MGHYALLKIQSQHYHLFILHVSMCFTSSKFPWSKIDEKRLVTVQVWTFVFGKGSPLSLLYLRRLAPSFGFPCSNCKKQNEPAHNEPNVFPYRGISSENDEKAKRMNWETRITNLVSIMHGE